MRQLSRDIQGCHVMLLTTILAASLVLGVSLRILIATIKSQVPDLRHLDELAHADSQLVSLAQKAFTNSRGALVTQIFALDFAVIAVAISSYLETKRLPKAKIHLSKWVNIAMYTGYFVALQALIQFLQNFNVLGEVVFSGSSDYNSSFWALKLSAASLAGIQFGAYLNNTKQPGEQDVNDLLSLVEYTQERIAQLNSAHGRAESSHLPVGVGQEKAGQEAI